MVWVETAIAQILMICAEQPLPEVRLLLSKYRDERKEGIDLKPFASMGFCES